MSRRYRIFFSEAAKKELRKLGASAAKEILPQIDKKLTADPVAYGKALSGALAGYYRLRVGGYRIVYTIVDNRVCVVILAIGKRNEAMWTTSIRGLREPCWKRGSLRCYAGSRAKIKT